MKPFRGVQQRIDEHTRALTVFMCHRGGLQCLSVWSFCIGDVRKKNELEFIFERKKNKLKLIFFESNETSVWCVYVPYAATLWKTAFFRVCVCRLLAEVLGSEDTTHNGMIH